MYTCIAIDDDFSSLEILKDYISLTPDLKLLKTFTNPLTALKEIQKLDHIDIVFVDIEMPEANGMEISAQFREKISKLILITSFKNQLKTPIDADGYLLKPFPFSKFTNTLQKIVGVENKLHLVEDDKSKYLIVKQAKAKRKVSRIRYREIMYIEGFGNYIKIHTQAESIQVYDTLQRLQVLAENNGFIRCHHSFIVAEDLIIEVQSKHIVLKEGYKIPIGRNYKNYFLEKIYKNELSEI